MNEDIITLIVILYYIFLLLIGFWLLIKAIMIIEMVIILIIEGIIIIIQVIVSNWALIFVGLIVISCSVYLPYLPLCQNKMLQSKNIKQDLQVHIIAQKHVVNGVVSSFEDMSTHTKYTKVLNFVGTSGVGKTFVTEVLKRHFTYLHLHEVKKSDLSLNYRLKNFSPDCFNLFIIDNLHASDCDKIIKFVYHLPKDLCILVIPIFSIQGTTTDLESSLNEDDLIHITNKFSGSYLNHEILLFNQLTTEDVALWLSKHLRYNFHNINEANITYLIERLLLEHDILAKGLKGLHSKILLKLGKLN